MIDFLIDVVVSCQEEMLDLVGKHFGEEHEEAIVEDLLFLLACCEDDVAHV